MNRGSGKKAASSSSRTKIPANKRRDPRVLPGGSRLVSQYVNRVRRATPMDLVNMEREGVPGGLIKELGSEIMVTMPEMYEILGAAKSTVERKAAAGEIVAGAVGQAALAVVKLLALAEGIVANSTARAAEGFDTGEWLGKWLDTPQPALGGRKPSEFLDTPTGQAILERTLGALESGAYL